jgi:para-aminobenzoate synthetase component 1
LRQKNAAPFAAYTKFGDLILLSASPERFLQVNNRIVESRPIKGTIARSDDLITDQALAQQLLNSEKDKAENAMIVDLLRNDLSKVCQDNTVNVLSFAHLETYATVHHLVSSISGQLRSDCSLIDLMRASFPGGSITGAPKIRAMEIISEIEPINRGLYCGNLVYMGFDGTMDSSILIRTIVLYQTQLSFHAGGAVVLDSNAQAEYQETLDKARALHAALNAEA